MDCSTDLILRRRSTSTKPPHFCTRYAKVLGTSVIEVFKNAGKLIVAPVTDKVKDDHQKKQKASENKERAEAKKRLLEQMNN